MITLALLTILLSLIFIYLKKFNELSLYFAKQNIKYKKPLPVFGNLLQDILGLKHNCEIVESYYNEFSEDDIFGLYTFGSPELVIRNPKIIEQIMVKDFSHFTDRLVQAGPVRSPAEATLFHLCGLQWRITRNKLTPLFTSVKLKYMFESMGQSGQELEDLLNANQGKVLDVTDVASLYTLDVIGSIAYGIGAQALKNPDTTFTRMAYKIVEFDFIAQLRLIFLITAPKLLRLLRISPNFVTNNTALYFCDIIRDALERRKTSGVERPDFLQLMLALKEKGRLETQAQDASDDYLIIDRSIDSKGVEISDDVLIGAGFSFIFAGFHSSAMSMSFTLFELARNPQVLKKLKSELKEVCSDCITYDKLKDLKYLENVIKEALRLYPTVTVLPRTCTKEYTLPTGHVIKPGSRILIPVSALHKDPAYFPDPLLFNPDRFKANPIPGTYLPFGDGPRICIGMRLAMTEMKYFLAKVLLNYNIELAAKPEPGLCKIEPRALLTTPRGPINMRITRIKS